MGARRGRTRATTRGPRHAPLVAGAAVGCASLYLVVGAVGHHAARQVVGNAVLVLAPLAALGAALAAWRATRARAWLLLGAFCGLWAAGQSLWAYYELIAHRSTLFPSPADVGFLGAPPSRWRRRPGSPAALACGPPSPCSTPLSSPSRS